MSARRTRTVPALHHGAPEAVNGRQDLDSVAFLIGRAYYNYSTLLNRRLAELQLDRYLAVGAGQVLFALLERDNCIIKDLVQRVRVSPSTLTGTLNRMKRVGLIQTGRDSGDGRALRIKLTPLARSLAPKCRELLPELEEILHRGMSARDKKALRRLLVKAIDNMREAG